MIAAWFLSDLHLKDINERSSQVLLRFLHSLLREERTATHLFLVGDIFDIWVGNHQHYAKLFEPIVEAILELKKKGIEIHYFEGNHDLHVKGFWQDQHQIPVWVEGQDFQVGPWRVRVEHGDQINQDDKAYLRLRAVLRHWTMKTVAAVVPGPWMHALAKRASQESRKHSSVQRSQQQDKLRQMIRAYAQDLLLVKRYDFVISGHLHVHDEYQLWEADRKCVSVNLGSWFEDPRAYLINSHGGQWVDLSQ